MRFVVAIVALGSTLMVCSCNKPEEANTTPPASTNTAASKSGLISPNSNVAPANAPGPAQGQIAPATE